MQYKVGSLFAGIGGIDLAFKNAGFNIAWANEIDKKACYTYSKNFTHKLFCTDIKCLDISALEKVDIITAGFPCQPFSIAGKQKGFDDKRSDVFFDLINIVDYLKPKVLFLENVKQLKNHDKGRTLSVILQHLKETGYNNIQYKILNAKDFGTSQNRERIYIVGFLDNKIKFKFPESLNTTTCVGGILESSVDDKYTISDKLWAGHQRRKIQNKKNGKGFGYSLFNANSLYTSTISARYYKDGSEILIEQIDMNPRKITPREAVRLQGFPDNYILPADLSDSALYKQIGNSVTVPVVEAIANQINAVL